MENNINQAIKLANTKIGKDVNVEVMEYFNNFNKNHSKSPIGLKSDVFLQIKKQWWKKDDFLIRHFTEKK